MVKRAYQVDANVSVRCAILAEKEADANAKVGSELRRLLNEQPIVGIYLDIREIKPAQPREA